MHDNGSRPNEASERRTARLPAALAAVLMVTVGLAPVATATTGTITVCHDDSKCDFTDIQAALDAADPGDIVNVLPGTYGPTRLTIDTQDVTLTSENGPDQTTILVDGGGEDPIAVRADGVTVRGLTFDHSDGRDEFNVEIFDDRVEGVTIEGNDLIDGYLLLRRADDITIRDNRFLTADGAAFSIYGILAHFGGFNDIRIEDNIFEKKLFGAVEFAFGETSNAEIVDNTFRSNNNGIVVRSETDTGVEAHFNDFVGNDDAVDNKGDDPIDVTRNWWGDVTGPTHPNNPVGGGDEIAGPALFAPWCIQQDCPNLSVPPE